MGQDEGIRAKNLCLTLTLVNVKNNVKKLQRRFDQITSAKIASVFLKSQLSDGFLTVHSSARATPAKT